MTQPTADVGLAPCEWPILYPESGPCTGLDGLSDDETDIFEEMAAEYLWNWTGRRFGLCPALIRPCRRESYQSSTFWGSGPGPATPWQPVLVGGQWYNITCGICGTSTCSCGMGSSSVLKIPGPISEVTAIYIDGFVFTDYRVDDYSYLVRLDGEGWPTTQDFSVEYDQPGTWAVDYVRGVEVPTGGQIAAGVLACELSKAATADDSCRLPRRLQSITRQGVTVAVLDAFDDIDTGHTGIWIIDSWVASVTKARAGASTVVMSPDVPRKSRKTTWQPGT